jgi:hypothetical protein
MAGNDAPTSFKTLSLVLFATIMVSMLVVMLVEAETMRSAWKAERTKAIEWLGADAVQAIDSRTRTWYSTLVVDSGAQDAVHEALVGDWETNHPHEVQDWGLTQWLVGRMEVMWLIVGIILYRLAFIVTWLPPLLPFFVAATWDGICQRRIIQERFHSPSPMLYHTARWYMVILIGGIGVVLFIPATLPAYWVPVAGTMTAGFAWVGITNLRKRL